MKKILARFPNESFFIEIEIYFKDFKKIREFDTEIFGRYKGLYISVKK